MDKGTPKTSFVDNLRDVLSKINYRSDPIIRLYDDDLVCDYCQSGGHTTISCKYLKDNVSAKDNLLSEIIKI